MKKEWTRRKFLKTILQSSAVVGSATVTKIVKGAGRPAALQEGASSPRSDARRAELLRAAMDEIIPASDAMPSASRAGGVEYLERVIRESPQVKLEFEAGLTVLEEVCRREFEKGFLRLSSPERVAALDELKNRSAPGFFAVLRDFVYEAYYTRPQVWKLIGYEFHPTNQGGPRMKSFDESVLAKVRKMPKLYREAH